ncbi:hypothetical protein RZN05_11810 [Sphingomonas sp. HF-S4]|uniref:Uncharacterized protein n=1 Tax=Sphingomonas agrestis TaxID=3080540 RepID=A0ABU3Y914_9SPHN|nr:hypothetical protein [Sphingomonas sp. HF-S4]MDV3457673.1 hypothetical protein [Sphingomonas sp. HF-S4]
MPGLSNIFGSDDSNSSNDSDASGGIVGDVGSTLGLDVSSSQNSESTDEDGNSSSNSSDNAIGLDTSTDGLLGAVGDTMSASDESSS